MTCVDVYIRQVKQYNKKRIKFEGDYSNCRRLIFAFIRLPVMNKFSSNASLPESTFLIQLELKTLKIKTKREEKIYFRTS